MAAIRGIRGHGFPPDIVMTAPALKGAGEAGGRVGWVDDVCGSSRETGGKPLAVGPTPGAIAATVPGTSLIRGRTRYTLESPYLRLALMGPVSSADTIPSRSSKYLYRHNGAEMEVESVNHPGGGI